MKAPIKNHIFVAFSAILTTYSLSTNADIGNKSSSEIFGANESPAPSASYHSRMRNQTTPINIQNIQTRFGFTQLARTSDDEIYINNKRITIQSAKNNIWILWNHKAREIHSTPDFGTSFFLVDQHLIYFRLTAKTTRSASLSQFVLINNLLRGSLDQSHKTLTTNYFLNILFQIPLEAPYIQIHASQKDDHT